MKRNSEVFESLNLELICTRPGFELRWYTRVNPKIIWPLLMLPFFVMSLVTGQLVPGIITGATLFALVATIMKGWNPILARYDAGERKLTTATETLVLEWDSLLRTKKYEDGPVDIYVESMSREIIIYHWEIRNQYYTVPYPDVVRLATRMGELMEVEVEMGPGIEPGVG